MNKHIPQPDRCIACTTCTVVCPVAGATPNFLGPRMMGPAYERFRLVGLGEDSSLEYCSNCKNCDISCPCDVPISTFIMKARAEVAQEKRPPLRDWMLGHAELIGRWLTLIPAWLKNGGMHFPLTRIILGFFGVAPKASLPSFAAKTFRKQFPKVKQPAGLSRKVVFFPGCFVDMYDPACGNDIVWAFNKAGYEVIVPDEFVCCGLPMVANGFWQDAKANATCNLAILKKWKDQGIPVLTGCTSCSLMFKDDYEQLFPELLPLDLSPALADVCEFLQGCIDNGELALPTVELQGESSAVYHAPCHLRAQGMGLPGFEMLQRIPGLEITNADAGCCGISGSYGFKKEKYDISMRVGAKLFEAMRNSGASVGISECGTCRVQMEHGTGIRSIHPVTLLRRFIEQSE